MRLSNNLKLVIILMLVLLIGFVHQLARPHFMLFGIFFGEELSFAVNIVLIASLVILSLGILIKNRAAVSFAKVFFWLLLANNIVMLVLYPFMSSDISGYYERILSIAIDSGQASGIFFLEVFFGIVVYALIIRLLGSQHK